MIDSQGKHFLLNITIIIIKSHYSVFLITISYGKQNAKTQRLETSVYSGTVCGFVFFFFSREVSFERVPLIGSCTIFTLFMGHLYLRLYIIFFLFSGKD